MTRAVWTRVGLGVAFGGVAMLGGTPGSLFFGGAAALFALLVLWRPSVGCLASIICVAVAVAYADVGWRALLVAAACGLLGVVFVLAGRGPLRLDVLVGSAIAILGAGLGAVVDTGWSWLGVLVPVGAAAIYLMAMLALRTPAAVASIDDAEVHDKVTLRAH